MDLGPIQTDRPQFQHARLLRQQEHLHKEILQFGQEGAPKRRQGIVVGMLVACDEAEWYRLIRSALDLARAEHTRRVAIEKQAQQHFRRVRFPAARPVMGIQGREVKQRHAVHDKAGQMLGRQTVTQPHRQLQRLLVVHRFKCSLHAQQYTTTDREHLLLSDKLLGRFWEVRTQFQEAHRWIDAALKMTGETPPVVRAKMLMAASRLALWEIAYERSRELAQQALVLYEAIEDVVGKTWAIFQIGDTWHMQGEYTLATRYLEESLHLLQEQENWRGYAFTLSRLGAMATLQGNFPQARTWLTEAVPLLREYSEPVLLNVTLVYLGVLALAQGDVMQSNTYLREGLLMAQQTGNRYMLASDLIAFGCLLGTIRGPSYAARMCSAAEALFESLNTALPAAYRPLYDVYLGSLKSQVDETTWETWWAEGKALSQEEVSTLALSASGVPGVR